MLAVRREPNNECDRFAVANVKNREVVGHMPQWISKTVFYFLSYDSNIVFCEVMGGKVSCGVRLGLEVPCLYKFYGSRAYVKNDNYVRS